MRGPDIAGNPHIDSSGGGVDMEVGEVDHVKAAGGRGVWELVCSWVGWDQIHDGSYWVLCLLWIV